MHFFKNIFKLVQNNNKKILKISGICLGLNLINRQINYDNTYQRSLQEIENKETLYNELTKEQLESIKQEYKNLEILEGQVIKRLMSIIRDKDCSTKSFREHSDRVIRMLIEHVLSGQLQSQVKYSPCGQYNAMVYSYTSDSIAAVTVLRAGNAFLKELITLLPSIQLGQVLVQRNENSNIKEPILIYSKLPVNISSKQKVLLCDPMIATGGSMNMAIDQLLAQGVRQEDIVVLGVVGCREGIQAVFQQYPHISMVCAQIDPVLNHQKYICPGLGDYGDRYFGTL